MSRSLSERSSVFGSSCRYFASAMIMNSFMNSLGWKPKLPIEIQRELPRMSLPRMNTRSEQDDADAVEHVPEALVVAVVDHGDDRAEDAAEHEPVHLLDVDLRERRARRRSLRNTG